VASCVSAEPGHSRVRGTASSARDHVGRDSHEADRRSAVPREQQEALSGGPAGCVRACRASERWPPGSTSPDRYTTTRSRRSGGPSRKHGRVTSDRKYETCRSRAPNTPWRWGRSWIACVWWTRAPSRTAAWASMASSKDTGSRSPTARSRRPADRCARGRRQARRGPTPPSPGASASRDHLRDGRPDRRRPVQAGHVRRLRSCNSTVA
jgi:hypothetical protein